MSENMYNTGLFLIDKIRIDPVFNCRLSIDQLSLIELAQSIEKQGLLEPLLITDTDDSDDYNLVAGFRRLTAIKMHTDHKEVFCHFVPGIRGADAILKNLTENLSRKELNVLEEAKAIKPLFDLGLTEHDVMSQLSKRRGWIQVRKMLLALPEPIQKEVALGNITQLQIRDLYSYQSSGEFTDNELFDQVKLIKSRKARGQKDAKVNLTKKARGLRNKTEIEAMLTELIRSCDIGLHTRVLAWASGNITYEDLYDDMREYCSENGLRFKEPNI